MPARSSGCATCVKRRIRCDERWPGCRRCATHGVPCPGYRKAEPGDIEIIDLSHSTAQRATHQYKQKSYSFGEPLLKKRAASMGNSNSPSSSSISSHSPTSRLASATATNGSALAQTWADALFPLSLATSVNTSLRSPAAMSSQMYSAFLDVYMPKNAPGDHRDFFCEMAIRPNHDPTLIRAMNTLSLVAVGGVHNDKRVVREAALEYGQALNLLACALRQPNFKPTDEIVAATTVLALCEFYDGVSGVGGWHKHLQGAQTMLLSRGGPERAQTRFGLMLISNARHGALAANLITRKTGLFGKKAWRRVLFQTPVMDSSTYFYDHALQVPGLMERRDNLALTSHSIIRDIDELLEDFEERELGLRAWFAIWVRGSQLIGETCYSTKPMKDFPIFAGLVHDQTFEEAFWFPDFPSGYLAAAYWSTLHFLLTDKIELYVLRQELEATWQPPDKELKAAEEDLHQIADYMCMCMPYFCEPISSLAGQIGIFLPMHVCADYFRKTKDWRKALWLHTMRESVFIRGMIPPR